MKMDVPYTIFAITCKLKHSPLKYYVSYHKMGRHIVLALSVCLSVFLSVNPSVCLSCFCVHSICYTCKTLVEFTNNFAQMSSMMSL